MIYLIKELHKILFSSTQRCMAHRAFIYGNLQPLVKQGSYHRPRLHRPRLHAGSNCVFEINAEALNRVDMVSPTYLF